MKSFVILYYCLRRSSCTGMCLQTSHRNLLLEHNDIYDLIKFFYVHPVEINIMEQYCSLRNKLMIFFSDRIKGSNKRLQLLQSQVMCNSNCGSLIRNSYQDRSTLKQILDSTTSTTQFSQVPDKFLLKINNYINDYVTQVEDRVCALYVLIFIVASVKYL